MSSSLSSTLVSAAPSTRGYWTAVAVKLTRDKVAVTCAAVIGLLILMAIFAPWLAPEDPLKSRRTTRSAPTSWAATCSRA
jgi:peptide/nickel transport system permease protein